MGKVLALVAVLAVVITAAILANAGAARVTADYYWGSLEADFAVQDSDWGDARNVGSVSCRGLGSFKKVFGEFVFKRFRCELKNRDFDRIGFVTVRTVGPEAWKPENFVKPRCS